MKNSLSVKFVAVLLCALSLLGALSSGICLGLLGAAGLLGDRSVSEIRAEGNRQRNWWCAQETAIFWASGEYGGMPQEIVDARIRDALSNFYEDGKVSFTIRDRDGNILFSNYSGQEDGEAVSFSFDTVNFERFLSYGNVQQEAPEPVTMPIASGVLRTESAYTSYFYDNSTGRLFQYVVCPGKAPGVDVTLYFAPDALKDSSRWDLVELLWNHKTLLVMSLIGCLLLFAANAVYLCSSAGHKPGTDDLKPAGLNALPLDLYAAGAGCVAVMCILILNEVDGAVMSQSWQIIALVFGGVGFVGCLVLVAFCFAFAAQVKLPSGYWWWNSICGRCMKLAGRLLKKAWIALLWLLPRLDRQLRRVVRDLWKVAAALIGIALHILRAVWQFVCRTVRRILKTAEHFFSLLPMTWQWLCGGGVICCMIIFTANDRNAPFTQLLITGALVAYSGYCFGTLLSAVKKMRSGKLEEKVDGKYLIGSFREFSEELNGLADVAVVAAEKQLKSDRMKAELITNVSHDIKTPLTSIINYVDLLQKPHTPEQEQQYLEVLSRQSGRMKKLIEDLMEMSKASTGNIPVEITQIDGVEAVNQALGEFADKLDAAGITPVFQHEDNVTLLADGRLLWRAMSNILSNAVKYAQAGTRLYVDIKAAEDTAVISFKNISGAQLNISAEELMERFVRGDSSRNTEGSGLGLNITKSLMELQKGQLQLLVDGDLFKVTLIFPKA